MALRADLLLGEGLIGRGSHCGRGVGGLISLPGHHEVSSFSSPRPLFFGASGPCTEM